MINPIYKKKKEIESLERDIKTLYSKNKYKECIQACEKLGNIFIEKNELVYLYLGKCNMNLGYYDKSRQAFEYCIQLNEMNMECYINLGTICAKLNQYDDAIIYYDKYDQLLEHDTASKNYLKNKISFLNNISNTFFMIKEYQKAQDFIYSLLEIEPLNKSAMLQLGDIYFAKEEFEKAEEQYFAVLQSDSSAISASYKLGMTNWKLEKFTEAIGFFELSLSLNKRLIESYQAIGQILFKHFQKYDEALFNLKQFIQYNQKDVLLNVQVYLQMGDIYETLFKSNDAIECYNKAHHINKYDTLPLLKIALIYFDKRQDYKAASEHYEQIIRIKPSCKHSFIQLGKCHFELKKYDKCIQVYKNELLLDPYNSETFQAIALCYQELHNYKEADIYFQLSLQINPYDQQVKEQYAKLKVLIKSSTNI